MSNFDKLGINNDGRPKGKLVNLYLDCSDSECDEETSPVEFFPNESVIKFTCAKGHANFIEGFKVPL